MIDILIIVEQDSSRMPRAGQRVGATGLLLTALWYARLQLKVAGESGYTEAIWNVSLAMQTRGLWQ